MTGTPPATRPPVYSPFLRETLRRLSGERSCGLRGSSKFEQILIADQYLHNLVFLSVWRFGYLPSSDQHCF